MNTMTTRGVPLRPAAEALTEMALTALVRSCIASAACGLDRNVNRSAYVRSRWGDEARSVETVLRSASAPAMTTTVGWAKELAPVTVAFLQNLVPMSAGADLLGRALGLSFDGAAQINVPTLGMGTALADFVAEGASIPVVQANTSLQATLLPFKFAVISVLSREMIESSNAEQLVRTALLESTGPALDRRLLDNVAGSATRPPGLLHGITPLTPSANPGGKSDSMLDDLQALLSAVAVVAGNSPIVVIASPAQAVSIKLRTLDTFDYSVLVSSQLAPGTVVAVATAALVSASGDAPSIDTTKAASVQMNDSPSGDLMSGGHVIAAFQNDVVGLRLRWPLAWAVRDARGVAYVTGVSW